MVGLPVTWGRLGFQAVFTGPAVCQDSSSLVHSYLLGGREVSATHLGEKPISGEDAAEKRRSGLGWEPGTEPGRKEPRGRPRPSVSSGGQWCSDSHGRRLCRKGPPTLGEPAGLPALRGSGGCLWVPVAQSTLPLGRQPRHGSARQELPTPAESVKDKEHLSSAAVSPELSARAKGTGWGEWASRES